MSTTGEKFARESVASIWEGVWFTSLFFLPAGIYLTYKAANDSIVFNVGAYIEFFKKLRFSKKKVAEEDFIEEWFLYQFFGIDYNGGTRAERAIVLFNNTAGEKLVQLSRGQILFIILYPER